MVLRTLAFAVALFATLATASASQPSAAYVILNDVDLVHVRKSKTERVDTSPAERDAQQFLEWADEVRRVSEEFLVELEATAKELEVAIEAIDNREDDSRNEELAAHVVDLLTSRGLEMMEPWTRDFERLGNARPEWLEFALGASFADDDAATVPLTVVNHTGADVTVSIVPLVPTFRSTRDHRFAHAVIAKIDDDDLEKTFPPGATESEFNYTFANARGSQTFRIDVRTSDTLHSSQEFTVTVDAGDEIAELQRVQGILHELNEKLGEDAVDWAMLRTDIATVGSDVVMSIYDRNAFFQSVPISERPRDVWISAKIATSMVSSYLLLLKFADDYVERHRKAIDQSGTKCGQEIEQWFPETRPLGQPENDFDFRDLGKPFHRFTDD